MTPDELTAGQLRKVALLVKLAALLFGAVMGAMIGGGLLRDAAVSSEEVSRRATIRGIQ